MAKSNLKGLAKSGIAIGKQIQKTDELNKSFSNVNKLMNDVNKITDENTKQYLKNVIDTETSKLKKMSGVYQTKKGNFKIRKTATKTEKQAATKAVKNIQKQFYQTKKGTGKYKKLTESEIKKRIAKRQKSQQQKQKQTEQKEKQKKKIRENYDTEKNGYSNYAEAAETLGNELFKQIQSKMSYNDFREFVLNGDYLDLYTNKGNLSTASINRLTKKLDKTNKIYDDIIKSNKITDELNYSKTFSAKEKAGNKYQEGDTGKLYSITKQTVFNSTNLSDDKIKQKIIDEYNKKPQQTGRFS